jgi:SNF2 family DNA or RNA helicase
LLDVLIATYSLVARDLERLRGQTFATLVRDEAQAVKNAQTRRARAARALRSASAGSRRSSGEADVP